MLTELRIRDFVIIDSVELEFAPGLNVITGETGAGKSILIDSIALLMGDKAEPGMVRAGCERALLEGVFKLATHTLKRMKPALAQHALDAPDDEITLGRELRANGRSICRVNGTPVSQHTLREVGEILLDVHGQSEHLSLLRVREHANLLDDFAGTWDTRRIVAGLVGEWHALLKRMAEIEHNARENARRVDMLKFQVEEITTARLKPNEEHTLTEEHTRLANAESISEEAGLAYSELYDSGSRDAPAALDRIAAAAKAIASLARFDAQFEAYHKSIEEATGILQEVARSVGEYRDAIEFNPKRLSQVESRLELIKKLKRKYGESVDAVIAFGERARSELDEIVHAEENMTDLREQEKALKIRVESACAQLSAARKTAAKKLQKRIEAELEELKMGGAKFEVQMATQTPDTTGADAIEFMIAPNPGEGLKPLVKVASGGETARLMLALKAVLASVNHNSTPTLIFDEVDQGIGGRVGTIVGQKLWGLTHAHQVLCITHLPQLASYADAHFKVQKLVVDGRTRTATVPLTKKAARMEELALMLGTSGKAGEKGAEQLLSEAEAHKKSTQ